MREYPYLAIDRDGRAHECTTEPKSNGDRWFTKDWLKNDEGMRGIKEYKEENYSKVMRIDSKHNGKDEIIKAYISGDW